MPRTDPFDRQAAAYDEWFERHRHVYQSELEAVRRLLPRKGKGIEIGVGTGRFAAPLGIACGLEPSAAMARIAEARGVSVIPGVAEQLPIVDSQFDFVLLVTTICFLDDADRALSEAFRVLRPGGAVIIGFVDRDSPLGREYQRHKGASAFYQAARFYSAGEVAALLAGAGFRDLVFVQTLVRDLRQVTEVEPVLEGHGRGGFVVVRGARPGGIPDLSAGRQSEPAGEGRSAGY